MNLMPVLTAIALCLAIGSGQGETEGSYKVLFDGKLVGQERFQTTQLEGVTKITSSGRVPGEEPSQQITTMTEIRKGAIVRYTIELNKHSGIEKYWLNFIGGNVRVAVEANGRNTERLKQVSDGAVLLDKNVWHHYRFLLSKYDLSEGGIQTFNVFIPQAAFRQYRAEVEMKKKISFEFRHRKVEAYRFEILLADTYDVIVITDERKIPLSIEIPSEKVKAILE
jgi:hypothetical protein